MPKDSIRNYYFYCREAVLEGYSTILDRLGSRTLDFSLILELSLDFPSWFSLFVWMN